MKEGNLNLYEDDGLTPWVRVIVKKFFILKQFKGALTAEDYDNLTEDEHEILEIMVQEMGSSDEEESVSTIFGV